MVSKRKSILAKVIQVSLSKTTVCPYGLLGGKMPEELALPGLLGNDTC